MKRKNVLITGVSTGIGYECSLAFAEAGYKVFGTVRKAKDALALQELLGAILSTYFGCSRS